MTSARTGIRVIARVLAVLSVVVTALTLVLAFDVMGAPPVIPDTADFPTRVLESQAFQQTRWPVELVASLLLAGVFALLIPLGALLSARTERPEIGALLSAGGVLGVASQLIHVGANQVAVSIGYCDCGFKTEEAISQAWALMISSGISDWLLHGASILLAGGVLYAASALAGREMPASWGALSRVLAGMLVLGVALSVLGVGSEVALLLIALVTGIVLPLWAGWLSVRIPDAPSRAHLPPPAA